MSFYNINQFFKELKKELEKITGKKLNYRIISKIFFGMESKWHINDKLTHFKANNYYTPPWNLISRYEKRLRDKIGNDFDHIIDLFQKIRKLKRNTPIERIKLKKDYFKILNTKDKAYFYGYLLADGHLDGERLLVELDVKDAEILKRFIEVLEINPKYVFYKRRNKNKKKSITLMLKINNKEFVTNLKNLKFPIGMKSNIIRFPASLAEVPELALSCLLGYFDGDGSHGRANPNDLPLIERKSLRPYIKSSSIPFLNDVKRIFNIPYNISKKVDLSLGSVLFNRMLSNYYFSLRRKRYKGYLSAEELIALRINNLKPYWSKSWRWFKFSETELKSLWEKGWSDKKIVDYHKENYNIEITERTVEHWRRKWKLFHNVEYKIAKKIMTIKELLPLEKWTLEKIYVEKLGYKYDPSNNKHQFRFKKILKEWFSNDHTVNQRSDIVQAINEVYTRK